MPFWKLSRTQGGRGKACSKCARRWGVQVQCSYASAYTKVPRRLEISLKKAFDAATPLANNSRKSKCYYMFVPILNQCAAEKRPVAHKGDIVCDMRIELCKERAT
jgi:hypothetical protein